MVKQDPHDYAGILQRRFGGDQALMLEALVVSDTFLRECFLGLHQAMSQGNASKVAKLAHSIAGTLSTFEMNIEMLLLFESKPELANPTDLLAFEHIVWQNLKALRAFAQQNKAA